MNNSLAAAQPTSAFLRLRAANEVTEIATIAQKAGRRLAVVPMLADEPVGVEALGGAELRT